MTEKYVARVITTGFDDGDTEGPFYKYFSASSLEEALSNARDNHEYRFQGLHNWVFENWGFEILKLDVKKVGRREQWFNLFDYEEWHRRLALEI